MTDERKQFTDEMADETRAERGLYCMTQIMTNPDPLHLLAACHDWDDLAEEPARILQAALDAEEAADQGDFIRAKEDAASFIDEAIAEYTPLDEFAQADIEKVLGVEAEQTGGGIYCFAFYKPGESSLLFGWANGGMGYYESTEDGRELSAGELPSGAATDAQVRFIRETCARLGYTIPDACADGCKRGCSHDAAPKACGKCGVTIINGRAHKTGCPEHVPEPGPVAPPTPYTVRRQYGASVVYDANGGAITGPINGEAAILLAAAPEMRDALKTAEKIIKTARQYFPKSIKNPDRFALELAAAEIGKALHRAQEAK